MSITKYPEFNLLSDDLQYLLIQVKASQVDGGHYDDRGYYAEFDSGNSKPYTHETIMQVQEIDWVTIHADSDESRELEDDYVETEYVENDDGEEEEVENTIEDFVYGVCFVTLKDEFLALVPDYDEDYH